MLAGRKKENRVAVYCIWGIHTGFDIFLIKLIKDSRQNNFTLLYRVPCRLAALLVHQIVIYLPSSRLAGRVPRCP